MRCALLLQAATLFSAAHAGLYDLHERRANETLAQLPSFTTYPSNGASGKFGWDTVASTSWVSGFWPGVLLKLYNRSVGVGAPPAEAAWWLANGAAFAEGLAGERFDTGTHDVGFIMYTSFGQLWHLTGNQTAREFLHTTATSLSTRFSPVVGCLRSWNNAARDPPNWYKVIADNLMNLELLWWAGEDTGNATFTAIAHSHTRAMMRDLFQPFNPGCAWHLITYDAGTGAVLNRSSTPQGLGLNTVWSRGQAWALNGFVVAHRFTGEPDYLSQAVAAADCFLRQLEVCCGAATRFHGVPLWDFNATGDAQWVDTSAAMIAAEALVELAWSAGAEGPRFLAAAMALIDAVEAHFVFADGENNAVVNNGTVTYPLAGISIIYDEYYHLTASMKLDATPGALREAAEALRRRNPAPLRGNGNVYAVSLNGTNNEANFMRVSLDTYSLWAGPPLPGVRNLGQAAIVSGGTFWTAAIVNTEVGEGMFLLGIDTVTGGVTHLLNTSTWPGVGGGHALVEELFPSPGGGLVVVARVLHGAQLLYTWTGDAVAAPVLLGAVNVSGGDLAFDGEAQRLFEIVPGASDDDSGTLVTVSTGPGAPSTVGSVPLASHFGFPQWLGPRKALLGLSLTVGGPNGYARNVTLLDPRTGATQDLGELGDTCVGARTSLFSPRAAALSPLAAAFLFVCLTPPPFPLTAVTWCWRTAPRQSTRMASAPSLCSPRAPLLSLRWWLWMCPAPPQKCWSA